MSDNLVLEHLRHIRTSVDATREDVRELKHRMTTLEIQVANSAATEASHYASLASGMDGLTDRLDRVERRLDIAPAEI